MNTAARTVTFEHAPAPPPKVSRLLPIEGREILVASSQYMPRSQRAAAINKAAAQVRKLHPQFFKKEA